MTRELDLSPISFQIFKTVRTSINGHQDRSAGFIRGVDKVHEAIPGDDCISFCDRTIRADRCRRNRDLGQLSNIGNNQIDGRTLLSLIFFLLLARYRLN